MCVHMEALMCEAICVFVCVCYTAGKGRLMFALEDCMTIFFLIPVRIVGIICNLTTAACQKATNRPYGYVRFTALIMLPTFFIGLRHITCCNFTVCCHYRQPSTLKPT